MQHTVFQLPHPRVKVTHRCIQELKDASYRLKLNDKIEYFAACGVNYVNVVRYTEFTKELDRMYTEPIPWYALARMHRLEMCDED